MQVRKDIAECYSYCDAYVNWKRHVHHGGTEVTEKGLKPNRGSNKDKSGLGSLGLGKSLAADERGLRGSSVIHQV
jgi:hypothetical protein